MRFRQQLLTGAVSALLAAVSVDARAQTVDQELRFGGGGHFEFAVPVYAQGQMKFEIDLPAGTPFTALLFSPREQASMARSEGTGNLSLSYQIPYGIDSWRAPEEWMFEVVLPREYASAVGTLRVSFPSGNQPDAAVVWRNAGPVDPAAQARVGTYLDRAEQRLQSAGTDGVLAAALDVVRTRLNVLAATPARYVRHDHVMQPSPPAVVLARADGPVSVTLRDLTLIKESLWHAEHGSDRVWLAAVVLSNDGTRGSVGRSAVYRLQHSEAAGRYTASEPIVMADDEARLLTQSVIGDSAQLVLALLEHEHSSLPGNASQFGRAMQLFAALRDVAGPEADAELCWLTDLITSVDDALVGPPYLVALRRAGDGETTVDLPMEFARADARYRATIEVATTR